MTAARGSFNTRCRACGWHRTEYESFALASADAEAHSEAARHPAVVQVTDASGRIVEESPS